MRAAEVRYFSLKPTTAVGRYELLIKCLESESVEGSFHKLMGRISYRCTICHTTTRRSHPWCSGLALHRKCAVDEAGVHGAELDQVAFSFQIPKVRMHLESRLVAPPDAACQDISDMTVSFGNSLVFPDG